MEALRPGDPRQLGPYRLRGRLGEGGMGEVFLGVSPSGLRAAVKTVRPEYAHDPGFRDRFRREVAAARRVDSAWTAPIAEADPDSDPPWLATEFLTGMPLSEAVARYGPLPERAVRVLAAQLVEALMAIHRAGLVHRDLKPSNVILGRDRPRVIDFGISYAADMTHALTSPGGAVGSPGYMSPEQAGAAGEVDYRSDVFALGGVLAYAATGRAPFSGPAHSPIQLMYRIIHGEPDLDGVPEGLRGLVVDCLAKDPAARPALTDILQRTVGDADVAAAAAGGAWVPAELAAELIRRQNADPIGPDPLGPDANGDDVATEALDPAAAPTAAVTPLAAVAPTDGTVPAPPPGVTVPLPGPRPPEAPPTTPPTAALTQAATDAPVVIGPPGTAADASARGGLSRRTLLVGGAVVGVAAVGGAAGWALSGGSSDSGLIAGRFPLGQLQNAESVLVTSAKPDRNLLVVAADGAVSKNGSVASGVVAIDLDKGQQAWSRSLRGRYAGAPVVGPDAVYVVAWSDAANSYDQTKAHTLYALSLADGTPLWQQDFATTSMHLARETKGGALFVCVGTKSGSSSDAGTAQILALDPRTGATKWRAAPGSNTPEMQIPWYDDATKTLVVACQPPTGSYGNAYAAVYALDAANGDTRWTWSAAKEQWCASPAVLNGKAFLRCSTSSSSSAYAENRTLTALDLGKAADHKPVWRTTDLPAGWGPSVPRTDAATGYVLVVTSGSDSEKTSAWVQAFDATTGGLRWQFAPQERNASDIVVSGDAAYVACTPTSQQSGTVPRGSGTASPTATPSAPEGGFKRTGRVYAVDVRTGAPLWTFETGGTGWLSEPQVVDDVVCVGMSDGDGKNGAVLGVDAKTGRLRWRFNARLPQISGLTGDDDELHVVAATDQDAEAATAIAYSLRPKATKGADAPADPSTGTPSNGPSPAK
ncbi:protein kinase domain-containing protein [Yinghuangia seranimata]|uniref:serine/threonine-protein kinase n=1 Tax=Yinghuangia seranimata TaxID=408067 RepID=UPI00248B9E9E|nr:serine/threonine-protein kinase [Yinghuangia seranimata]MDI2131196.1 PQQ-binding-like beta-propeller repeat protein [Yinghuangia seranimata]